MYAYIHLQSSEVFGAVHYILITILARLYHLVPLQILLLNLQILILKLCIVVLKVTCFNLIHVFVFLCIFCVLCNTLLHLAVECAYCYKTCCVDTVKPHVQASTACWSILQVNAGCIGIDFHCGVRCEDYLHCFKDHVYMFEMLGCTVGIIT